jgi:hypothetical protein
MADIVLTGDTSGAITVAAPAVAGTNTLTLPAETGTCITSGTAGAPGNTGTILQMVMVSPDPGMVTTTNTAWGETSSALRLAITPKSASSTLVLTVSFMFGGGNTSQISYFKFYDITNAADVNLGSAGSNRTPCHGGARQVDTDDNDTDSISMTTTVSAGSTTARTYGMYNRKEGTDAAYFFGNNSDSSALGYARPTYTIMEVAS